MDLRRTWQKSVSTPTVRSDNRMIKECTLAEQPSRSLWMDRSSYCVVAKSRLTAGIGTQAQSEATWAVGRVDRNHLNEQEKRNHYEKGPWEQDVGALKVMDRDAVPPPLETYNSLLNGCIRRKSLAEARKVYAQLLQNGLELDPQFGESIVKMFVKCGSLTDALHVFDRLPARTALSWTAVISGYEKEGQNREALRTYRRMVEDGFHPTKHTFLSVIKACSSLADLDAGKWIHADLIRSGCETDLSVANSLVHLYVKCKSMVDAHDAFDKLPLRDVMSWNAMISGYVREEEVEKVFKLFAQMKAAGLRPSDRTYASVLKGCGILASWEQDTAVDGQALKLETLKRGQLIHAEVVAAGYETDVFVGTALVDMYSKCGSMVDARRIFDNLPYRNVVSWNAMIAGYAQLGLAEEALHLLGQMQQEGVQPNNWTFVSGLKACASLAAKEEDVDSPPVKTDRLRRGRDLHDEVVRQGYATDIFICNTLVHMYSKCGSMSDAMHVFETTPKRTVVTWSAIIGGYAHHEDYELAFQLYIQMQEEGLTPDRFTFVSVLKACGGLAALEHEDTDGYSSPVLQDSFQRGKVVHAEVSRRGYDADVFLGTSLIDMYARCGSMADALHVFDTLPTRNAISWNALIGGHAQVRKVEEAIHLYMCMQEEGVTPTTRTFVNVLRACSDLAATETQVVVEEQALKAHALQLGREIHRNAVHNSCESDVYVGTTLVDMYAKCGSMQDAHLVFQTLTRRDVVLWSAMIAGFAELGYIDTAFQLYAEMHDAGLVPDSQTLASALKACIFQAATEGKILVNEQYVKPSSLQQAKAIHSEILRLGYGSDVFVATTLIHMYAQCGCMQDARNLFEAMPKDNVVSWNALIAGYVEQQELKEALQLYSEMQVKPDEATYFSVLRACSNLGALAVCREIHQGMLENGVGLNVDLGTSLIYAYGKCGSMVDALSVFKSLPQQDVSSWTALMAGYAHQGNCAMCLQCFEDMRQAGTRPDEIAYVTVLNACSHAGMVDEGLRCFESLKEDTSITPCIEHYVSLADLYGRAGLFDKIEALVLEMPIQPDMAFWLSLLSSCRKHNKVTLGERAFEQAVKLNPRLSAPYLIMSNIYAEADMWDDVCRIDKFITELQDVTGAWKQPGQSWLEHENRFHQFAATDMSPTPPTAVDAAGSLLCHSE